MILRSALTAVSAVVIALSPLSASAQSFPDSKETAAVDREEDGKYYDADGNPTFKVEDDGTVDWFTFSGYRRYHADCHVCHGPDGVGSSYAPALAKTMKNIDYATFLSIVAEGRKNLGAGKENVMPAFGENKNVYCYMDDLYVYLRARSLDAIPRGRPGKRADKPEAAAEAEKSCMEG